VLVVLLVVVAADAECEWGAREPMHSGTPVNPASMKEWTMKTAMWLVTLPNAAGCAAAAFVSATAAAPVRQQERAQVLERSAAAPDIRKADRNFPEPNPAVSARSHDSTGGPT